ncbi:Uu.00g016970.m01.CDS01 [Anthostomella pinea]|uniref:Uu.00g016970.m01.CDS01 n=1 Tax=Anthostomella pinea TaxID=933095 RepID=A0AAI8YQH7_9PEZI|nr:Uu.00g016970.m01.CDS01 [Anthostomella pinea]
MSCGHILTHYTTRCSRGECAVPKGPLHHLADTCAACDPEHQTRLIKKKHDRRHHELMAQLYNNDRQGRVDEVQKCVERMNALRARSNREIGAARDYGRSRSALEVEFPGYSGECRWGDGKCVWMEVRTLLIDGHLARIPTVVSRTPKPLPARYTERLRRLEGHLAGKSENRASGGGKRGIMRENMGRRRNPRPPRSTVSPSWATSRQTAYGRYAHMFQRH